MWNSTEKSSTASLRATSARAGGAEEDLAKSERRFRSLIEYAADAIYVLSRDDGKILTCNERACKDTGYSLDELQSMFASGHRGEL